MDKCLLVMWWTGLHFYYPSIMIWTMWCTEWNICNPGLKYVNIVHKYVNGALNLMWIRFKCATRKSAGAVFFSWTKLAAMRVDYTGRECSETVATHQGISLFCWEILALFWEKPCYPNCHSFMLGKSLITTRVLAPKLCWEILASCGNILAFQGFPALCWENPCLRTKYFTSLDCSASW